MDKKSQWIVLTFLPTLGLDYSKGTTTFKFPPEGVAYYSLQIVIIVTDIN